MIDQDKNGKQMEASHIRLGIGRGEYVKPLGRVFFFFAKRYGGLKMGTFPNSPHQLRRHITFETETRALWPVAQQN